jgi:hypothetical protein
MKLVTDEKQIRLLARPFIFKELREDVCNTGELRTLTSAFGFAEFDDPAGR